MTFADEMAVVMSVLYEWLHVTGPDAESFSCIPEHRSSPNTEGMRRFFFFISLSLYITHTPSTSKLLLCRTRSAVADKWTRSNKDHLPENTKKIKIKNNIFLKKKMTLASFVRWRFAATDFWEMTGQTHLTDDTPSLVYMVIFLSILISFYVLIVSIAHCQYRHHSQCRPTADWHTKRPWWFLLRGIKYKIYEKLIKI